MVVLKKIAVFYSKFTTL